jgi:chemotaxis protein methyltransferase WspC
MTFSKIGALLKDAMGLDIDSIGASALEHAVRRQISARGFVDISAYLDQLSSSETELQELIEAIVVSETWFFRDREAFAALVRNVHDPASGLQAKDKMRLLSLPCSTGEEPYTIAMALLDAGIGAQRFEIDAFDISAAVIARACRGVYGDNSFRGKDLAFRDRHFEPVGRSFRLRDAVRTQVRFRQANFLAPDFDPSPDRYDAIFCRNMLIYFDSATQDRAVAVLRRLLSATALLFVGPSETALFLNHGFDPVPIPCAFAFRMGPVTAHDTVLKRAAHSTPIPATLSQQPARMPRSDPASAIQTKSPRAPREHAAPLALATTVSGGVPPEPSQDTTSTHDLEVATQYADRGDFAAAEQICAAQLRQHRPSAAVFHLMGLIRDAGGLLPQAAECYRKALYLDHGHRESLLHLALLLEKGGDTASARVLRNRAHRLDKAAVR